MDHRKAAQAQIDRECDRTRVEGVSLTRLELQLARDPHAVIRNEVPASAAAPAGGSSRPAAVGKARAVALEHLEVRQQVIPKVTGCATCRWVKPAYRGGVPFRLIGSSLCSFRARP